MNPMRPRRIQDSWRSEQLAKFRRERFEGAGHAWRRIHICGEPMQLQLSKGLFALNRAAGPIVGQGMDVLRAMME